MRFPSLKWPARGIFFLIAVVAVVAVVAIALLMQPLKINRSGRAIELESVKTTTGSIARYERATGRVINQAARILNFENKGAVQKLHVQEGQSVYAGQLLAEQQIDPELSTKIESARLDWLAAQQRQQQAQEDAAKWTALYDAGIESAIALRNKRQEAEMAVIKARQAQLAWQLIEQKHALRLLKADADARVVTINFSQKEAGFEQGIKLIDPRRTVIEARVDEQSAAQITSGQTVLYETMAAGGKAISGKGQVIEVRPTFERERDFFAVKVLVGMAQADSEALRLNQQLQLKFVVEVREQALLVPTKALIFERGQPHLVTVTDGVAHWLAVETGIEQGDITEIRAGAIKPGQIVTIFSGVPPGDGQAVRR
jgi:multidrug efflux pump subunit AcrA (membrane-fusion protein)